MTNNTLTLDHIKNLMQPIHSANHCHTALINPAEGRRAINLALLRWAGGAKQITLTQFELPPDAVGRIYVVDVFTGEVVDIKYTDWAKKVRRGSYTYTGTSNTKGEYRTFPHVTLDYIDGSRKRRHYRPMMHTIVAYVLPELREQYAQAVIRDCTANTGKTFFTADVQVNHMDKNVHNNSAFNYEILTAKENSAHKYLTTHGLSLSALRHFGYAPTDLSDYDTSGVIDSDKWAKKICKVLSEANLPPNTKSITIVTVSGDNETVAIAGLTVWGIITQLYLRQAYSIA